MMHTKPFVTSGIPIEKAKKVLIMLHGRGSDAANILELANDFPVTDFAFIAPQATNHSWYPYSFLAPPIQNEPWLSSAISMLNNVVRDLNLLGIASNHLYFMGFSQGACLALEYTARNAVKYGGIVAFTGGLIGDKIETENYKGDFLGTPVFIGTSDPDPHVPVERVNASAEIMENMHAVVTKKIYKNMGHTINEDEIKMAYQLLLSPIAKYTTPLI